MRRKIGKYFKGCKLCSFLADKYVNGRHTWYRETDTHTQNKRDLPATSSLPKFLRLLSCARPEPGTWNSFQVSSPPRVAISRKLEWTEPRLEPGLSIRRCRHPKQVLVAVPNICSWLFQWGEVWCGQSYPGQMINFWAANRTMNWRRKIYWRILDSFILSLFLSFFR